MIHVQMERFSYAENGTFGRLRLPSGRSLATVEKPWVNNTRNISCIPIGSYLCVSRRYWRGNYDAYEVLDVPERSHILFHKGNQPSEVEGCIALNSSHNYSSSGMYGVHSAVAFDAFMQEMDQLVFILDLTNYPGGVLQ
jgi:hypothetical protein